MKKTALFLSFVLLVALLTRCKKEEDTQCSDNSAFCTLIDKGAYGATSSVINKYLSTQNNALNEDEQLEQLRAWLICKSCVSDAQILCNSCIETNPPQSEIKVSFKANGQEVVKVLDIIMEEPLKFGTFHD